MNTQIREYLDDLTLKNQNIKSIYLIGSRANDCYKENSDWDFIVFAEKETLENLRKNESYKKDNIDLLVIYDGDNFESPWADGKGIKKGSLSLWKWNKISDNEATYKVAKYKDDKNWFKEAGMLEIKIAKAIQVWSNDLQLIG